MGDRVTVDDTEQVTSRRCARVQGFSLHADVAAPARDRKRLKRLSRYIARPPLANERLHRRSDGKLVYLFRKPWRDGTRGVVFKPAELLEKLIALIPHHKRICSGITECLLRERGCGAWSSPIDGILGQLHEGL